MALARPALHKAVLSALALAGALTPLACQTATPPAAAPTSAPAPVAAVVLLPTPTPTAPSSVLPVAPASVMQSATPSPVASPTLAPLPTAGIDSDLDQDDEAAVESLIDSAEIKALLTADLIHDGGVILYHTLAQRDNVVARRPRAGCTGPDEPPDQWKRQSQEKGGRQLKLRRVPGAKGQATVDYTQVARGVLTYRDANGPGRKPFVETSTRRMKLARNGSKWELASLSPLVIEAKNGKPGLELTSVAVYRSTATTPAFSFDGDDKVLKLDGEIPAFAPGETLRVECDVTDKQGCQPFIFAHLVGASDRSRQQLYDDGTNGDRVADDGIYSGNFVLPATTGQRHVAIEVLDTSVFAPGGLYRSNGVAMNFKVEGKQKQN